MHDISDFSKYVKLYLVFSKYVFSKYVKIYIPSEVVTCYSPLRILFNYNANFYLRQKYVSDRYSGGPFLKT